MFWYIWLCFYLFGLFSYTADFIPIEPWIIDRVCWFAFKLPDTTVEKIARDCMFK